MMDVFPIKVEKIVFGGEGLGFRADGKAVLVKKSLPGDHLLVETVSESKNFLKAKIVKVVTPSSSRRGAKCPYFQQCGGCDLQQTDYRHQLQIKQAIIVDFFDKFKVDRKLLSPIIAGSSDQFYYRNSIRFEFRTVNGQLVVGRHNYLNPETPVITDSCLLQSEFSNFFIQSLLKFLNQILVWEEKKIFWQIKIREGKALDEFMVELITGDDRLPKKEDLIKFVKKFPKIKSFYHSIAPNKNIYKIRRKLLLGWPIIFEKIGPYKFQIAPESFFQTNSLGVENLYNQIKKAAELKIGDRLLDLYAGVGGISIYLSAICREVVAVEIVAEAINDARDNAKMNKISNIKFVCQNAENFLKNDYHFDQIIVDPPRAGLKNSLIKTLIDQVDKFIYVSCNPSTFFRDLRILTEGGFKLAGLQPIDMFPQTHHIEIVSRFEK
jgi:23S rRNA (uracil1939-C5)-methyltransferase